MSMSMTPGELVKTVTAAGTPERLTTDSTPNVKMVTIQAKKIAGANTGNVHIGLATVRSATRQIIEMKPGDSWTLAGPGGFTINLRDLYIDAANSGDGVTGLYWQ